MTAGTGVAAPSFLLESAIVFCDGKGHSAMDETRLKQNLLFPPGRVEMSEKYSLPSDLPEGEATGEPATPGAGGPITVLLPCKRFDSALPSGRNATNVGWRIRCCYFRGESTFNLRVPSPRTKSSCRGPSTSPENACSGHCG